MAAKVGLLDITQHRNAEPAERVRRAVAECLVRQLLAIQITKYLYQRVRVRQASEIPPKPYIPDNLPSSELPGLKLTGLNPATLRSERLLARMAQQFCENRI